jgi:transposase InsO family protein
LSIVDTAKKIGFKEAADIAGIHYTTVYDWKRQIEALGKDAFLSYQPSRPGRGVKEISQKQEKMVLDTWKADPGYGPGQVRNQLRRQGETVSIRTVRLLMEANGYKGRRIRDKGKPAERFEASRPLELAQMDILEFFTNKLKVFLILLIDDFSRFILGFRLLEKTSIDDVTDVVAKAISRYGKMEELLTDRGFVFYSWRGANRFEAYLELERIDHTHARPHHPQTLGKVEALNKRIKTELIDCKHFSTAHEAESAIGKWVDHYNYHRTHQGFGGLLVPAERFHGKADQVLDEIAKGLDVTGQKGHIERSIVNLVLGPDGKVMLYLLGQPLMIQGGLNV